MLRTACRADLEDLCKIERHSFVAADWLTPSQMLFLLEHRDCRVILDCDRDQTIRGYAVTSFARRVARLYSIAVLPDYRGLNIGETLLNRAERCARTSGARSMILEARATSASLIAFYEAFGYRQHSRRRCYYENAIDGINMRKSLVTR